MNGRLILQERAKRAADEAGCIGGVIQCIGVATVLMGLLGVVVGLFFRSSEGRETALHFAGVAFGGIFAVCVGYAIRGIAPAYCKMAVADRRIAPYIWTRTSLPLTKNERRGLALGIAAAVVALGLFAGPQHLSIGKATNPAGSGLHTQASAKALTNSPPDNMYYHATGCRLLGRRTREYRVGDLQQQGYLPCPECSVGWISTPPVGSHYHKRECVLLGAQPTQFEVHELRRQGYRHCPQCLGHR